MRSFTIHVNFFSGFHASRKISAGWNGYRALGTICNDRSVQDSTLVRVQGVKPPETSEIWHFRGTKQRPKTALMTGDDHNPQKLNFDFKFHGIIIRIIVHTQMH